MEKSKKEPFQDWEQHVDLLRFRKSFWSQRAACSTMPTERLFPHSEAKQKVAASEICTGCPVQIECLNFALVTREDFGVWGGTTETQRSNMLSKLRDQYKNIFRDWSPKLAKEVLALVKDYVANYNTESKAIATGE